MRSLQSRHRHGLYRIRSHRCRRTSDRDHYPREIRCAPQRRSRPFDRRSAQSTIRIQLDAAVFRSGHLTAARLGLGAKLATRARRARNIARTRCHMINLAFVLPCYNEEDVLPATIERLRNLKRELAQENLIDTESTITFVDDGSSDRTWQLIENAAAADRSIHGIKLAKNRGHQNALIAGLLAVPGDVLISIDADLQDDLGAIRD